MVEADSIRPQNKVGLPMGLSDLMFLNIIHFFKKEKKRKKRQGQKRK